MTSTTTIVVLMAAAACLTSAQKTPVYVVLRMDDVNNEEGYDEDQQVEIFEWAQKHNVKMNIGIIAGPNGEGDPWPTTCATNPGADHCDHKAVRAVYKAYGAGNVRGAANADSAIFEIFNHAWAHDNWPTWDADDRDKKMHQDLKKSQDALSAAYPNATITTFVPPQNVADLACVKAAEANGLTILSSQGTITCNGYQRGPPRYNYAYAPCQPNHEGETEWYCIPPNDTYVSPDGRFQKISAGILSLPDGASNSLVSDDNKGMTPAETIGVGACGCDGDKCSIISAAKNNAAKSNGLHWTVVMMHPFTKFNGGDLTYTQWLDAFVGAAGDLKDYTMHFVHFQDLANMHTRPTPPPPGPQPTPPAPTPPAPAPGPGKHGTHHVAQGDYCGKIAVEECGQGTPCNSFADCPAICNARTVCPDLQVGDDVKFDCSLKGTYC